MQAYMRSTMPYLGVAAPPLRAATRELFRSVAFDGEPAWERTVRYLWDHAEFREERYAVIALTGAAASRPYQTPGALGLYGDLISSGAWWDYVDELAVRRVGPILRAVPSRVGPVLRQWSRSDDLWRRRSAIIAQVGSKGATDLELLAACIAPTLDSPEFFLRKAIGWALRQEARFEPDWVRAFVEQYRERLSGLSRREALKHLGGDRPTLRTRRRRSGPVTGAQGDARDR